MAESSASTSARSCNDFGDVWEISDQLLDHSAVLNAVHDDGAGAIASFIGTTRNNFDGKIVLRLEYQAYTRLAMTTMEAIILSARDRATSNRTPLSKVAIHHRIGNVPVGEISIIVAVSSPHRKEAFETCAWIVDEVKAKVAVWKREWYEGGEEYAAVWK